MFFGHIKQVDLAIYPKAIQQALVYLQRTDFDAIAVGRYELAGNHIYVQVLDLETQTKDTVLPEVHRNYLDVQYLHKGIERIGVATDLGQNLIATPYDQKRDILFYQSMENETELVMRPGNFAVFFPSDIHRPACIDEYPTKIRKVVVKIALSQLIQS